MRTQTVLFSRRYRAALLDYLPGNGEEGLARAYDLGRTAIDEGIGLLPIFRAHQKAVTAVLESTHKVSESLKRLKAAENFLMETLSPFEMTYRGYVALLEGGHENARERAPDRRRSARRPHSKHR
jgi:phosphoserine phosphatase RsbU-like protein